MIGGAGREAGSQLQFQFWAFREDVHIETDSGPDGVVIYSRWEETTLVRPSRHVMEAMLRMALGPISFDNVLHTPAEQGELEALLAGLQHVVVRSFGFDPAQPLISVVPLTPQAGFSLPAQLPTRPIRLSRFALISTDGNNYSLESPLSLHRVIMHGPDTMAHLGLLGQPLEPAKIDLHPQSVLTCLLAAGLVVEAEAGDLLHPVFAEDVDPALLGWTPLDLMFHTRSTVGRHDHDFGATYPLGERSVEPVVKPANGSASIALPRPGWDELHAVDPSVTAAVEATGRHRFYGPQPLTLGELGELLYRTMRVRSLTGSPDRDSLTSGSDRPYLSSGVSYELELYVAASRCDGVPPGIYHYDPFGHALEPLQAGRADLDELVDKGRVEANLAGVPPVLLVITARFRRLSWKYDGLSYSLVLKNVGALTQTLSLVSTAMGLASCGLDSGDIEASPRIFGVDWRIEPAVGGFAIGRHDPDHQDDTSYRRPVNDAEWVSQAKAAVRR